MCKTIAPRQKALELCTGRGDSSTLQTWQLRAFTSPSKRWVPKNSEGGSAFLGNAETSLIYMMDGFDCEKGDPKSRLEFDSEGSKQVIKQFFSMPDLKDHTIRSRIA